MLPLLPLAAAGLLLLGIALGLYLLLIRGPGLGDDWPVIPDLPVEEHSPDKWPAPPAPKRLKEITPAEFRTLCALCDTVLPAFADEAAVLRGCRAYIEELLVGAGEAEREALIADVTCDMSYYKVRCVCVLDANVSPDLID